MNISVNEPVETLSDGSIIISRKTRLVEAPDGSRHMMPVVNEAALVQARTRSIETGNSSSSRDEENQHPLEIIWNPSPNDHINTNQPIKSFKHLAEIVSSTESTIMFLRSISLLAENMNSLKCENEALGERKYARIHDKVIFYCKKCKKTYSIRSKSFFEKTRLSLEDTVTII